MFTLCKSTIPNMPKLMQQKNQERIFSFINEI